MSNSPFEIERRYLSNLPLRLQLPMLSTRVNKEYGTVELTAAATAFQSSDSSLCSVNYTFPVETASIAPVQLATLTKQLTHIFSTQRPTMDAWAPFPRPPSTVCQLTSSTCNVMLNISSIFSVIVV